MEVVIRGLPILLDNDIIKNDDIVYKTKRTGHE